MSSALRGRSVIVVGAGLAGLAAARELERHGARVMVVEARDRVGGRVHTIRNVFKAGQHAEAGADLIEGEQTHVFELATAVGLEPLRILRSGFTYYGPDEAGRLRLWRGPGAWKDVARRLQPEIEMFKAAGGRWDSGVAAAIGRTSVAEWLRRIRASRSLQIGVRAMRGFFLADPEDLSLLALVDQFAEDSMPGRGRLYRIRGGNDRLPRKVAAALRGRVILRAHLRCVRQNDERVTVTLEERGNANEMIADFAVVAIPTTTLKEVEFSPALPDPQRAAIATLEYGPATKVLLQFERTFWRRPRRPRAFGTSLPIGAVWDASEHQRGGPGILMLLAGGGASAECRELLARKGPYGVTRRLRWLGTPTPLAALWHTSWEDDPLARGGYAVFTTAFDPSLRDWLALPAASCSPASTRASSGKAT